MRKMQRRFKKVSSYLAKQKRDPRYIFTLLVAAIVLTVCFLQVRNTGLFDSVERPVFEFFNSLPTALNDVMYSITQLGGLGSLLIWMPIAWYFINRRAAFTVMASGIISWFFAKEFKLLAHRGRPGDVLEAARLFNNETFGGFGFPSGHSTFVAACVTVLYYQLAPKYRKYLLLSALGVGISRMYLGAHFPLDIVGGWALGCLIGSLIVLIMGVSTKGQSSRKIKSFLMKKGMDIKSLRFANVDARGSRPLFITTHDGKEYFGKVFGKQEHAADWLFKLYRFFRFKNMQAEEPHVSSRTNIQNETLAMMWAKQAGVRATSASHLFHYGSSWILIQEKIDAIAMSDHGHITQKSLVDAWKQVGLLHASGMAHRDLRAANLMVDKKGQVWIIDFGFAEMSAAKYRQAMDNAELLMSMSLLVGVDRTLQAATKVLDKKELKRTVPYLQKAVFSGATSKLLRKNKHLLTDLKAAILRELAMEETEVSDAAIIRFSRRKLINIALFAVFVYVIVPQFSTFRHAVANTDITNQSWFIPLALASLSTYVLTGIIYVALANVPLRIRDASLVQLSASFISKVIPGGLGSTTMNAKYMNKAGMEAYETTAVISLQAAIGFVMFIVPLGLFLVLNGMSVAKLVHIQLPHGFGLLLAFVAVAAVAGMLLVKRLRTYIKNTALNMLESFRNITSSPRELMMAAAASLGVTAAYVFCLYAALQSIGVNIGASTAIVVYATAVIAKSALPTPGGLGPVEAAMITALVSFRVEQHAAIAAVLIYRLATFWIPIPFSLLSYRYITRKKLI